MSVRLDDVATIDEVPSSVVGAERENAPRARRVSGTRGLDEAVFVHDRDAREAPDLRAPQDASPGPPASGDSPGDRAGPSGGEAGLGPGARDAPPVFLKFPIDAALTRDQRLASSSRASPSRARGYKHRARVAMASRAFAADEVPRDFDAEEAMRAELEALGEDVCSSEEERSAEDGAFSSLENARGAAGDPARSPPYGRAWGWDRDPVEDVQRAWKRREARLRRNSASFKVDDECSPDAPRDDAPAVLMSRCAMSASASSGDETSSEGETRETRAAFLRAYEARERARARARGRAEEPPRCGTKKPRRRKSRRRKKKSARRGGDRAGERAGRLRAPRGGTSELGGNNRRVRRRRARKRSRADTGDAGVVRARV